MSNVRQLVVRARFVLLRVTKAKLYKENKVGKFLDQTIRG